VAEEQVGRIAGIWRYPVKSMAGEELLETPLSKLGVVGDRAWAVRDEVRGGIRGAKQLPRLMGLAARYVEPPTDGSATAEIELDSGMRLLTSDPDIHRRISEAIEHEVTLWPRLPAKELAHYRRGKPTHSDPEAALRALFARTPGEPLPDLSIFPRELLEYESPPGTYFDAFPLLLLSSRSLAALAERAPTSAFDLRRFRPNLLVEDTGADELQPEAAWVGARLRVGDAILAVAAACPRCVMTTHGFADLPKDPRIMRALVREVGGNLGVYARVEVPGQVRRGDALVRLD